MLPARHSHDVSGPGELVPHIYEVSEFSLDDDKEAEERVRICQYAHRVLDYSSQYGSDTSISYTAFNIIGRQSKYPDNGDFPETFAMVRFASLSLKRPSPLICSTASF